MKLRVQNLGPLQDVTLPIRPLTVIIGPNNQGKTWLAYLAYAAMKASIYSPIYSYSFDEGFLPRVERGQVESLLAELHRYFRGVMLQLAPSLPAFFQDAGGAFAVGKVAMTFDDDELLLAVRSQSKIKLQGV